MLLASGCVKDVLCSVQSITASFVTRLPPTLEQDAEASV